MLSLESTSSRMTHLAQQLIYYGRFYKLEEVLESIDRVKASEVRRLARQIFDPSYLTLTAIAGDDCGQLESIALKV